MSEMSLSLSFPLPVVTESRTISWMVSRVPTSDRVVNFVRVCILCFDPAQAPHTHNPQLIYIRSHRKTFRGELHERARPAERYTANATKDPSVSRV